MGLLTIIKKQKLKDREIRVLMLGLDNSGKTTIVKALLKEDVKTISPTLGFNIRTIEYEKFKVSIWDVGGQRTLRPFWRNYYEQTDSLIWVVDATDLGRLPDCKKELDKVMTEDRLTGASLLVFVNKLDAIVDDSSLSQNGNRREKIVAEVRNALELDKITKHHWNILGCSAYDGTNLKEGLEWVVEEVKNRLFLLVD